MGREGFGVSSSITWRSCPRGPASTLRGSWLVPRGKELDGEWHALAVVAQWP